MKDQTKTTGIKYPDIEVQLTGEDGNGYAILGRITVAMRRNGINEDDITEFKDEARTGDYDHLLQTCMKWVTCL